MIGSATTMQLLLRLCCAVRLQMQQGQQNSWSPADSDGGHNQRQSQKSVSQYKWLIQGEVAPSGRPIPSHMHVSAPPCELQLNAKWELAQQA